MSYNATYSAWYMKKRREQLADEWKSYEVFLSDMGEKPSKEAYLIRPDRSKPFGRGNARWGTRREASCEIPRVHVIQIDGEDVSYAAAAARVGLSRSALHERLRTGWRPEDAVRVPPGGRRPRAEATGAPAEGASP